MNNFTKGKWKVRQAGISQNGYDIEFNDDGELVCECVYEKSDAHLIAAAPEMYALLDSISEDYGFSDAAHQEICKLLAKARGEK